MNKKRFVGFMLLILENKNIGGIVMQPYIEMTIEEAMKRCNKNKKVLVAVQDLEDNQDVNIAFVQKDKSEYPTIFKDIQTAVSICDDFVNQFRLFTEKQNVPNIQPRGQQRIVLLQEM